MAPMFINTPMGSIGPFQPWVDVQSENLMWHDKGRQEWVGHNVKLGADYFLVDRVEDRGDGIWRLYLIEPAEEQR